MAQKNARLTEEAGQNPALSRSGRFIRVYIFHRNNESDRLYSFMSTAFEEGYGHQDISPAPECEVGLIFFKIKDPRITTDSVNIFKLPLDHAAMSLGTS